MVERVVRHCLCGATLTARSNPVFAALRAARHFDDFHIGDGHGPASHQQAAAARRRALTSGHGLEEAGHA
jgi:hypothetical protein